VLVAAACGGGGGSTQLYTLQATKACLQKAGVRVTPVSDAADFVASTATGGAFRADVAKNFVTVSFGLTLTDATNIDQAYVSFHAAKVGINDVLKTQQNAVMLWHAHPSNDDIATITGCLSSKT
jgi:hypothetical protein